MMTGPVSLSRSAKATFYTTHPAANLYTCTLVGGATTAINAGDTILSLRTGTGTGLTVLLRIRVASFQSVAFATTGVIGVLDTWIARNFTASDSGGIAADLTGNNAKARTSDPSSTLADLRIANTAALTVGTRTLDAQSYGCTNTVSSTTTRIVSVSGGTVLNSGSGTFIPSTSNPLVLAANEGIVVRHSQTNYPATGTLLYAITVCWMELPAGSW